MTDHNLANAGSAPYGVFSARRGSPQATRSPTTAERRWDGGSGFLVLESGMTDILADFAEWRDSREERIGTHSDRCHLWHPVCMAVRLAREVERLQAENGDYRREVREQRLEIAGLREERAALVQADRPFDSVTPDIPAV